MSELRYRHPDEATAVKADRPQRQDSPYQQGRRTELAADSRLARDNSDGYDADAEFKRPVPKPEGYLPDDIGGGPTGRATWRWRGGHDTRHGGGPADGTDPRTREDLATAPRLREGADSDQGDVTHAVVDYPEFHHPTDKRSPDRYGEPLTRPDGTRVPCFDGPPHRDQTRQGWPGDCGIIAALGAVAAYQPEEIARRIRPREDGYYQVTLSEARASDGVSEPTGRNIELTVSPELPVYGDDPVTPACAKTQDGAAWCAVAEKAFAGVDQTWTAERRAAWKSDWAGLCAQDQADNAKRPRSGPAPTGYLRLHEGTTPWERAEALTQLTGQPAVVREFPNGPDEWLTNRIIRDQLTEGKPVLVSSRPEEYRGEILPHDLAVEHVYEVTGVEKGQIILRNPWNHKHPQPMESSEFARNMSRYYSTLM
jgi:hypothetical protein